MLFNMHISSLRHICGYLVPKLIHYYAEDTEDGIGDLDRFKEFMYDNEETRSRFTTYSMSSSVLKRNNHLR